MSTETAMEATAKGRDCHPIRITDVKLVSSYNCIESDPRAIVVPGIPGKWLGCDGATVKPDFEPRYLDQNSGRWPSSPMEPTIRAVLHQDPKFDFTQLDLISDRPILSRLLTIAVKEAGTPEKSESGPGQERAERFGFDVQVIGETLVFMREGKVTLKKKGYKGFTKKFEKVCLEYPEALKDTASHHRVVSYRLDGLRIMLCHEAGGYVAEETSENEEALSLAEDAKVYDNITVKSGGRLIPREDVLELNTFANLDKDYSVKRLAPWLEADNAKTNIPDLTDGFEIKLRETWLGQQPHYIIAIYQRSEVLTPAVRKGDKCENLSASFHKIAFDRDDASRFAMKWETEKQQIIQRFYDMLQSIVQAVRSAVSSGQGNAFMVRCAEGSGEIKVYKAKKVAALPEDLCERMQTSFEKGVIDLRRLPEGLCERMKTTFL